MTLAQLEGPNYFNDKAHAAIYIEGKEELPHEDPKLAAKGVKQYIYIRKTKVTNDKLTEGVSAEVSATLTPETYTAVTEHMKDAKNNGNSTPAQIQRKITKGGRKRTGNDDVIEKEEEKTVGKQ